MDEKQIDETVLSLDEVFQDEETLRLVLTAEQWEVIIALAEAGGTGKIHEVRKMTRMEGSVIQEVIKQLLEIGIVARMKKESAPAPAPTPEPARAEADAAETAAYLEYLKDLNYYQILQLNPEDDAGVVRRAYFRLMREYHPDRFMKEPDPVVREHLKEIFRILTRAYETLTDPQRRREYDLTIPDFTGALDREDAIAFDALWSGEAGVGPLPEANPDMAKSFYESGLTDFTREDLEAAELNFKLAVALDGKNADYQSALAKARKILAKRQAKELALKAVHYEEEKKIRSAINAMKRAVEMDQENPELHYELARLELEHGGDLNNARMHILLALDRKPGRADYLFLFARVQDRLGESADARRTLKKVLSLDPGNAAAQALMEKLK